jgi:spore coat polysaccharide biosynthesis predicted glycosyltransferase SpsG
MSKLCKLNGRSILLTIVRYILRADASQSIGSGHVMRLYAIAEELIARGEKVIFVGNISEVPWLEQKILGIKLSEIFHECLEFNPNPNTDILILDSYHIPIQHSFLYNEKWKSIVTIADASTPSYNTDLLIYPSVTLSWNFSENKRVLAGPKYIPLRKSIIKNNPHKIVKSNLEIVVVGGGTDYNNFVGEIATVLVNLPNKIQVSLFSERVKDLVLDSRFTVFPFGAELDEKAKTADLVFTTASTSSLEFIARGIPIGIGCAVNNQEQYYESLCNMNIASPIGRYLNGTWQIDLAKIKELINNSNLRKELSLSCANLIDLNGAKRIADEVIKLSSTSYF